MTVDAVDSAAHGDATDAGDLTDEERRRVADAAELYYVQGLKVEDVGKRMHLSRSTVSRMLARPVSTASSSSSCIARRTGPHTWRPSSTSASAFAR